MRNLDEEHENKEDEEYSETNPKINDSIKSKISKCITEEYFIISLLAKEFSLKVISIFILSIDTYEQVTIEVGNNNIKIKTKKYVIILIICP